MLFTLLMRTSFLVHERTFVRQSVGKSADQKFITLSYAIPVALVESWNFHTVLPARNIFFNCRLFKGHST